MINSNKTEKTDENKDYSSACLLLDEIIARSSDKLSKEQVELLLSSLCSLERGILFDKIVLLLKKIAKTNSECAEMIFHTKLPN